MSFTVIVPARFASSRLPGKPLADIAGMPMIQRVMQQAGMSQASRVIAATDDERIESVVKSFGGEVVMTSSVHPSGTDRLQEVVKKLGLSESEIVVNVQGDEPLIPPEVIDQVAMNLADNTHASVATLCEPITERTDVFNSNIVKIALDANDCALYFSRAPIPWVRDNYEEKSHAHGVAQTTVRHIGIYAYKVGLLNQFISWPLAPIEKEEKLEQLRILYEGHKIHVAQACKVVPGGVDTPEDLARIQRFFH